MLPASHEDEHRMGLLLLSRPGQPANTYGCFAAELLKADGFSDLRVASVDAPETLASLNDLDTYDAVLVTRQLSTKAQAQTLVEYVKRGGRLIAIRPARLLATGLGLMPVDAMLCPAYVKPLGEHPI